jgi:hypothetical protein
MWADTDTDIDFLNYSEVAELIAEMIGKPDLLPLLTSRNFRADRR